VSLSYKGENESDFTSLTPADGTPSFVGQSSIDIVFMGGSKQTDAARHWLVDYIRGADSNGEGERCLSFQGFMGLAGFKGW
ncbi:MAG: hypothetical protein JEZ02_13745, partial [Desulfatibacillum sp.]|nr:hypothetical protein [Desulfatibacillum sp.]